MLKLEVKLGVIESYTVNFGKKEVKGDRNSPSFKCLLTCI